MGKELLMGDSNIYICAKLRLKTADFVDTIYASLPYPNVYVLTRITSISTKFINNILYNNFTKGHGWKHSYFYLG